MAIVKQTEREPYEELASEPLKIPPGAPTHMRAVCTDVNGEQNLMFWLNGELAAAARDKNEPLSTGTVGLGVG